MIQVYTINSGGTTQPRLRFNSDSGSNYALRHERNGAADATNTSESSVYLYDTNASPKYITIHVINITDEEKLGVAETITQNTAGAGTAPLRQETAFKWANTTNQITSVSIHRLFGSGTFAVDSEVTVYGTD